MAKQSGIHQIRGKIEGRSYYRQSGVNTGLSRSINQGLSARVKSGDEYVNTRKNNAEFGSAADTAKQMAKMVDPKFRPMFLTFSQAKLTTSILRIIKNANTGAWGQRELSAANLSALASSLQELAKNDPSLIVANWTSTNLPEGTNHVLEFASGASSLLESWGATAVQIKVARYSVMAGKFIAAEQKFAYGTLIQHGNAGTDTSEVPLDPDSSAVIRLADGNAVAPTDPTKTALPFDVVVIMPVRTINGSESILQEHCTFMVKAHDFE